MEGTNKRKLSIMLVVILLMQIVLPVVTIIIESDFTIKSTAADNTWNLGTNVTATLNEETGVLTVKGTGKIKSRDFAEVGPWTESQANKIKKVIIEDGITSIGMYQFNFLTNLEEVKFGKDVELINNNSFGGCVKLKTITFNEGLKQIELRCFQECAIANIVFPSTLQSIGYGSFNKCEGLRTITYLGNTKVDDEAFENCSNICTKLSSDGKWFYDKILGKAQNIRLKRTEEILNSDYITIPEKLDGYIVTSIAKNGLKGCNNIVRIEIPSSIKNIGESAFEDCNNLSYVTFKGDIENIYENAFKGCDDLEEVYFKGTNLSKCKGAFWKHIKCIVYKGSITEKTLKDNYQNIT